MRAHTITTEARDGARARTTRTITPGGILALSLAVVLLGATASNASATRVLTPWYCPPTPSQSVTYQQILDCGFGQRPFGAGTSFDFGNRKVGTTSPAQRVALGVYGPDTFDPRISVSGDYAQTNDCPQTLSVTGGGQPQGCLITVTFTPTGTGPKGGALSTGPGGPTATLTGTGVTTPTPPTLPLQVFLDHYARVAELNKKLKFLATTTNDSTLVVRGNEIKRTTKRLAAGEQTTIKVKLKHPSRFGACEYVTPGNPAPTCGPDRTHLKRPAKIKVKATDEFDQTATDGLKITFYKCAVTC
jgi:hypothetical protein